jgi:hypothetical protein
MILILLLKDNIIPSNIMEDYMFPVVTPAYGRDYKSARAAIQDWKGEKDFRLQPEGCYCSIRDFPNQKVEIRYDKLMKLIIV